MQVVGRFFGQFMGVSGWLFILYLIISGIGYSPYNGTHWLLWSQWLVVLAIWQFSRWGIYLRRLWSHP